MNRGWTGKDPALDVTLLSLHPKVMRFRGMLTAKDVGPQLGTQELELTTRYHIIGVYLGYMAHTTRI